MSFLINLTCHNSYSERGESAAFFLQNPSVFPPKTTGIKIDDSSGLVTPWFTNVTAS